jgi:hypothetical protein
VTQSHDSPDQWEVHTHVTPRGRRLQAEATYIRSRRTLAALSRLGQEDREAVSEALPVLEAVANSAMGCAVPNGPRLGRLTVKSARAQAAAMMLLIRIEVTPALSGIFIKRAGIGGPKTTALQSLSRRYSGVSWFRSSFASRPGPP